MSVNHLQLKTGTRFAPQNKNQHEWPYIMCGLPGVGVAHRPYTVYPASSPSHGLKVNFKVSTVTI